MKCRKIIMCLCFIWGRKMQIWTNWVIFYLDGEKIGWETKQTGAIGKMNTKGLDKIIDRVSGELSVQPFWC